MRLSRPSPSSFRARSRHDLAPLWQHDTQRMRANPVPANISARFHRALLVVLLQPDLCSPATAAALELLSSSTRACLEDSLYFVWAHNVRARRPRHPGALLRSARVLSQRVRWAKLSYVERVALPAARDDFAHHANRRVRRTARALRVLQHTPSYHSLDLLALFPRQNKFGGAHIYGMLCDLAVLPDPRLARVLSIKRMSAMTSIVTDSVATILAAKRRLHELNRVVPGGLSFTFSFIAAGTAAGAAEATDPCGSLAVTVTTTNDNTVPAHASANAGAGAASRPAATGTPMVHPADRHACRADLSSEPGFLGYAADLFELRPEHEFLRERVLDSLFGCFCMFETHAQSQAAWDKAQAAGTFAGEHVCFLALDTYDNVVLEETQDRGFRCVWQKPATASAAAAAGGVGVSDDDPTAMESADNPFTTPQTSSMLTADERNNSRRGATSQEVIMFSHGNFRVGMANARAVSARRLQQLEAARARIQQNLSKSRGVGDQKW
jgi:hypothetical protein